MPIALLFCSLYAYCHSYFCSFFRKYRNWHYLKKFPEKNNYWKKCKIPITCEFRVHIVTSDLDSFIREQFNFCVSNDVVIRRILLRYKQYALHFLKMLTLADPEFLNIYGAQESIPRNQFRQPM
jgi:hypothetical protein